MSNVNGGSVGQGPKKNNVFKCGIIWDFVVSVVELIVVIVVFSEVGSNHANFLVISAFVACALILLLTGLAVDESLSSETPSFWEIIKESLVVTLYVRSFQRAWNHCWNGREEQILWKPFVYGCNQDRIACSTRSYGIAIVFSWILIATKAETGWETCTVGEGLIWLIMILQIVKTSIAATTYEIRYHQERSSTNNKYFVLDIPVIVGLFFIHCFCLYWKLHFMAFNQLRHPWVGGPISLIVFIAINMSINTSLEKWTEFNISALVESPQKGIIYPHHFLLASPATLPCSVRSKKPFCMYQVVIADLLPMLCGQIVSSVLSAYTSDPVVRELPYFCQLESDSGPLFPLPKIFWKYDTVGIVSLSLYAVFLMCYWLYAQIKLTGQEVEVVGGEGGGIPAVP